MRVLAVAVLASAALGGCLRDHPAGLTTVDGPQDCAPCHQAEFDAAITTNPVAATNHQLAMQSSTGDVPCGNCHTVEPADPNDPAHPWKPALLFSDVAHDDNKLEILYGPHAKIGCAECHLAVIEEDFMPPPPPPDVPNQMTTTPANVSCIGCHTGDHDRPLMDEVHKDVSDPATYDGPIYAWDDARPTFCRDCHPRGLNEKN